MNSFMQKKNPADIHWWLLNVYVEQTADMITAGSELCVHHFQKCIAGGSGYVKNEFVTENLLNQTV